MIVRVIVSAKIIVIVRAKLRGIVSANVKVKIVREH
jgi:hypothetical protein